MPEHPLKIYEELDSKLLDLVNETRGLALADGALPRKLKLLMAIVLDAVHRASDGVESLARFGYKRGATKEEIAEALRVASMSVALAASTPSQDTQRGAQIESVA